MRSFRLAHLSDIHFGDENGEALAGALDWISSEAFDLVVVSGDLTRRGAKSEFEAAATWLDRLRPPRLVTPGNHDTAGLALLERLFAPFQRFERYIGPADAQVWRGPSAAVLGFNSARGFQMRLDWSKGCVTDRQMSAVANGFQDDDALRVVVAHHPLVEMIDGPMSGQVLGGARAAARLAHAGVDLVLSGHVHAPFVRPYPAGDGKTWAVGAGTLSHRERGVLPGFNVIEAGDDRIDITALGWSGSDYSPARNWTVERRQR